MSNSRHIDTDRKAPLRERFNTYRRALSADNYHRISRLIVEQLKLLEEIQSAAVVHLYWPMIDRHEIDTRPLFRWLEEREKSIVLPKIVAFSRETTSPSRLTHVRYPGREQLVTNKWGIAEPQSEEAVDLASIDLVVAPTLGAGRNGHRIGHGYGYYDEFLASTQAPKIGLVYDECLLDSVPSEPHDVPLDILISESAVIRPASM